MEEPYFWCNKITNKEGKEETTKAQKYRNWWMRNGCPPISHVCEHFNLKAETTFRKNYVSKYGWRDIEDEAIKYYNYLWDKENNRQKKKIIESHKKRTKRSLTINEKRKDELLIDLGIIVNPETGEYEPKEDIDVIEAWEEIRDINKQDEELQGYEKDHYNIPRKAKEIKEHHLNGDVDFRLKKMFSPENLKE